jgi:predicted DNA-binding transcriptional regulator AlpA
METRIVRLAEIASTKNKPGILPVSRATIWRWVREKKFPQPFKIGTSVTVWKMADIDQFLAQREGTVQ